MEFADAQYVFCGGQLLVRAGSLEPAPAAEAWPERSAERDVQDSFMVKPQGIGTLDVAGLPDEAPRGFEWTRVRRLIAAESPRAPEVCRALGLLNWRATHRFCGVCGEPLGEHETEMARQCHACGHTEYPSISPAVIVRVEKDGNILLAQHVQRSRDFYTCLAGYIEVGESAEEAVRREVREEAGIELKDIRYVGSQHWPYPNQLMMAFSAQWKSGELKLQAEELSEARWFGPDELPKVPPPGSVAYRLIHGQL